MDSTDLYRDILAVAKTKPPVGTLALITGNYYREQADYYRKELTYLKRREGLTWEGFNAEYISNKLGCTVKVAGDMIRYGFDSRLLCKFDAAPNMVRFT